MNSMSEYFDSDDLARFGSFRFTGGMAYLLWPHRAIGDFYSQGIIAFRIWCRTAS